MTANGGGRYDPGILHYMPQTWCSDNADPISRLKIHHGTSLVYPPCTMDAAVAVSPTHQCQRATSLRTRAYGAMAGLFGFQLDLSQFTEPEIAEAIKLTALAKRTRRLRATGDLYRLRDPFTDECGAWAIVARDRSEAVVTYVHRLAEAHLPPNRLSAGHPSFTHLRVAGLDPDATYRSLHGPAGRWRGDYLLHVGLPFEITGDFDSILWHLQRE